MANNGRVVLNDRRSGDAWAVQRSGELIANWDDLLVDDDDEPDQQENDQDTPPEVEKVQVPPVAIDDAFGARPGRATVLPVLLNDYDPNGDVLVVSDLAVIDEAIGRIDLINERQQIQLTLNAGATGQLTFSYVVSDGRGGTDTATVVITIRGDGENSPPVQVRSTEAVVQSGGRVTTQVLGDWVDPDGDAMYLQFATVDAPAAVTYKPEGTIVYSDAGSGSDVALVTHGRLRRLGRGHRQRRGHRAPGGRGDDRRRSVRRARVRGRGEDDLPARPRARRLWHDPAQQRAREARRHDPAELRGGHLPLLERPAAHLLPRVRRHRRPADRHRGRASGCRGTPRREHQTHHDPQDGVRAVPAQRAGGCRGHRHRPGRRRAARHGRHEPRRPTPACARRCSSSDSCG